MLMTIFGGFVNVSSAVSAAKVLSLSHSLWKCNNKLIDKVLAPAGIYFISMAVGDMVEEHTVKKTEEIIEGVKELKENYKELRSLKEEMKSRDGALRDKMRELREKQSQPKVINVFDKEDDANGES